jgi:hypothetical protein
VSFTLPDEYQDGGSAGSLAKARRCWLDLTAADAQHLPQLFTFVFHCPTERSAIGLMGFLRAKLYAGFVRTTVEGSAYQDDQWSVVGTTHAAIWSLSNLEHLFMRLRGAGLRYESTLVTLDLLPMVPSLP